MSLDIKLRVYNIPNIQIALQDVYASIYFFLPHWLPFRFYASVLVHGPFLYNDFESVQIKKDVRKRMRCFKSSDWSTQVYST